MIYQENDLVRIAKRENNNKRSYLVVDPLQGKHIPAKPSEALKLFSSLADTMAGKYDDEKILFVGFAETATAIGSQVAIKMNGRYIQTTREIIENVEYLFFSEEHSHAAEQKLVKDDFDNLIGKIDRIIFVEDEVTTGNTIMNIIKILEKLYEGKVKFSIASLLNGMPEENVKAFEERDIPLHYLVKTDHSTYGEVADKYHGNGYYFEPITKENVDTAKVLIEGLVNARRLVWANEYKSACEIFWKKLSIQIGSFSNKKVLVVGTEEFMYPALYIGSKLEEEGNEVRCHSTTRSPIAVSLEKEYPLHNRYELKSLYDKERKTYIYDIGKYDKVYIVTDSPDSETEGLSTLLNALQIQNENITLIRWC